MGSEKRLKDDLVEETGEGSDGYGMEEEETKEIGRAHV